jgi:hypothetical protein
MISFFSEITNLRGRRDLDRMDGSRLKVCHAVAAIKNIISFMCMFCRLLFFFLYFFFWQLCFLFFFDTDSGFWLPLWYLQAFLELLSAEVFAVP